MDSSRDDPLFPFLEYLFHSPSPISQVHRHQRHTSSWLLPPHEHQDEIQFDFSYGFEGTIHLHDSDVDVSGTTAMFFPTSVRHAYELNPKFAPAIIYSIKLRVPSEEFSVIATRLFPEIRMDLRRVSALLNALERAYRLTFRTTRISALLCSVLSEVFSLWPSRLDYLDGSHDDYGDSGNRSELSLSQDEQIEMAIQIIERNMSTPPSLDDLAKAVGLSPRHFVRRFRAVVHTSPHVYFTGRRIIRAQELLAENIYTVTEIADILGFPSIHSFSRWFSHQSGISPSEFRTAPSLL